LSTSIFVGEINENNLLAINTIVFWKCIRTGECFTRRLRVVCWSFRQRWFFPQRIEDDSLTSMIFIGEINESNLPPVPLWLNDTWELFNALRASAIRSSLELPMTVVFLRRNSDIISTYFFGDHSTAPLTVVGPER